MGEATAKTPPPNDPAWLEKCQLIAEWMRAAPSIVAFTGAGISTESGIPDFRSPGGIWSQAKPVYYSDFVSRAEARHEYWRQKAIAHRDYHESQPNAGHNVLAAWEREGRLRAVLTQNIDGLHQLAGSQKVLEIHGTARQVSCLDCGVRFDAAPWVDQFVATHRVPDCPQCGGLLKHATISFGQSLDEDVLAEAFQRAKMCDLMFALGSSLVVEPAASLPRLAKSSGARLVIINHEPTPQDASADAVLHAGIGITLEQIDACLRLPRHEAGMGADAL